MPSTHANSQLTRILQHVITWGEERVHQFNFVTRIEQPLYHYTTLKGLEGMIRSDELWFTDAFHLNDTGELQYGLKLAADIVRGHPLARTNPLNATFTDEIAKVLELHAKSDFCFLVASFTSLRDDLNQWRAYGDHARGCALGLSPDLFRIGAELPSLPHTALMVCRMIYSREEIARLMSEVVNLSMGWLIPLPGLSRQLPSKAVADFLADYSTHIAKELLLIALRAKHQAFKSEEEVRATIAIRADGSSEYLLNRIGASDNRIPYLSRPVGFSKGGLVEVMIGPAAPPTTQIEIEKILRDAGIDPSLSIVRSELPFR